ncbi:hypothetical protein [Streptomyces shenzhenensis]|uniref:Uncharacterized protein n=1 Tax=Streptomyces shenzhenensis TaxID=943815 RepID=A0A3M0IHR1_9ACTN|nr:hypothetical protein [Streptomyces shenzhenensis]RMB81466.1 hypothetical protein CTZ28_34215 [Streptomyces shenzhenensis]
MAMDFASLLSAPPSGRPTALIVDHQHYARAVILQGRPVPWTDPVAFAQYAGQAQGLLRSDATLLDLGAYYDDALARQDTLRAALSARPRTGYALRTLLAHEPTAVAAAELTEIVAQTSAAPLVVQIPSPLLWLARTHELSGAGPLTDLNADHPETAAMYVADWLRRLAAPSVSMLLLDERDPRSGRLPQVDDSVHTPVGNVTDHYRWALGRRTGHGVRVVGAGLTGPRIPQEFWHGAGVALPSGDFLLADIPADAAPETVLAQLTKLN